MQTLPNPAAFVIAGKAKFTIVSKRSGVRFTYRVRAPKDAKPNDTIRFVSVLNGPDNMTHYGYLGFIKDGAFIWGGRKAKIAKDAPSAVAFDWFWRHLPTDATQALDVFHEGACGRCGRTLTVPESIASGFGPECIRYVCA